MPPPYDPMMMPSSYAQSSPGAASGSQPKFYPSKFHLELGHFTLIYLSFVFHGPKGTGADLKIFSNSSYPVPEAYENVLQQLDYRASNTERSSQNMYNPAAMQHPTGLNCS